MKKVLLLTIALVFSIVAFGYDGLELTDKQIAIVLKQLAIDRVRQSDMIINYTHQTEYKSNMELMCDYYYRMNVDKAFNKKYEKIQKQIKQKEKNDSIAEVKQKIKDSLEVVKNRPIRIKDSLVCFTKNQEKVIVRQLKTIEYKDSINYQLRKKVKKQEEIINNQEVQIIDQRTIIQNKEHILDNAKKLIQTKDKEISTLRSKNILKNKIILGCLTVITIVILL